MKKNILKRSFASTLAVAMVATAIPASFTTASAAKLPTFNKTAKYLYINENEVGNEFDLNINNKLSGWKYQWATSNKNIATVGGYGMVRPASQTGVAYITCKITFKNKNTRTLKAKITVKENANKVWGTNVPTEAIGVGAKAHDFNSAFSTASGAKATDYRVWEISKEGNTAGATFEGEAKYGIVNTKNAGEFKIRVRAYQSKAKLAANDTVDSEWYTIKVAPSVKSVVQTSTTKVAVTFDDNMKSTVKASDFAIKNKATNIVSTVKDIEFSEDGKVVTVETFASYLDNSNYVLTYGDKEFDFATSIGEVATIEVTTNTVVENKEEEIKYVLKNANGVDITAEKKASVTIEAVENNDGWLNGDKITLFKKGATAKVKLTYHTYKFDTNGNEEGAVSTVATITAVEESAATIGAYKNYVITDKESVDFKKETATKNVIAVGDKRNLFLNAVDSNDKAVTGLTFESGNDNMLLVSTDGDKAVLTAVNEGSTVVVVKNSKGTVLWTLPVVIKAERKANSVVLDKTNVTLVADTEISTETIEVTVKDQHNDDFTDTTISTPEAVKTYANGPVVSLKSDDNKVIEINAKDAAAGTYQYKVALSTDANKFAVLTVVVKANPETAVTSYKFNLSKNTVDTIVDDTITESKSIAVDVLGYASGLAVEKSECKITVKGPNGYTATYDNNFKFEYVTVSNSVITKLEKGTYTLEAVKEDANGVEKVVAKTAIVVNDTQSAPTIKLNSATFAGSDMNKETVLAALRANTTVKNSAGVELEAKTVITDVEYRYAGNSAYIKSVTIAEDFNGKTFNHKVTFGKTITIK